MSAKVLRGLPLGHFDRGLRQQGYTFDRVGLGGADTVNTGPIRSRGESEIDIAARSPTGSACAKREQHDREQAMRSVEGEFAGPGRPRNDSRARSKMRSAHNKEAVGGGITLVT